MRETKAAVPGVVYFLAATGGLAACNLYYAQPLLPIVAQSVGVSPSTIAYLPALTQFGFACGILAILPLADMVERRSLVATMLVLVGIAALAQAVAATLPLLLLAGFALGATCIVPQLLTPYAALLAPRGLEGQSVGLVLSGILTGVLVSKVIAGFVATTFGWRTLYLGSSALMVALAVLILFILPRSRPPVSHRYGDLLRSTLWLALSEPTLRRHTLYGGLAFAAFMIFWSNYAVHLAAEFGYGPDVAGVFGFAGIAGIVAASVAGRQIDRGRFNLVCVASGVAMVASYLLMLASGHNVVVLVAAVLLLDAGMALCHSANQSTAFALRPEARGRINAIYMTGYFLGGALGTTFGALALEAGGWPALCALGAAVAGAIPLTQLVSPVSRTRLPLEVSAK